MIMRLAGFIYLAFFCFQLGAMTYEKSGSEVIHLNIDYKMIIARKNHETMFGNNLYKIINGMVGVSIIWNLKKYIIYKII